MDAKMLPHFTLGLVGRNVANAIERDWEGMLPELVCTIARKVADISDFIRFRAVCKKWRSVTTIADMAPQFPWLLNHSIGPNLCFYSIALDKSFSIHAPKFSNKEYFNPCHGLILVHSSPSKLPWTLINPLNNNEISLPGTGDYFYEWIGSRSCQNMDYVVVEGYNHLHVLKLGDDKWIHMERKDCETYFHFKNLLFIVDELSRFTKVIDLRTQETVFVVPPPRNTWMLYANEEFSWSKFWRYPTLIESYGDVLLVTFAYELKKFVIHRLEVGNGQGNPHWVEVKSIGDRILFIDFGKKCGDFSLKASDLHGLNLKGNCIYYITEHQKLLACNIVDYYYAVEKYDIESATTEDLHIEREDDIIWYLPALNHV